VGEDSFTSTRKSAIFSDNPNHPKRSPKDVAEGGVHVEENSMVARLSEVDVEDTTGDDLNENFAPIKEGEV